jgi:hypothetical protein
MCLFDIEWKLIIHENPLEVSLNYELFRLHIDCTRGKELKLCSAGVVMNASIG